MCDSATSVPNCCLHILRWYEQCRRCTKIVGLGTWDRAVCEGPVEKLEIGVAPGMETLREV